MQSVASRRFFALSRIRPEREPNPSESRSEEAAEGHAFSFSRAKRKII
jgi:hypothetical protein